MNELLRKRLNGIFDRITSADFLASRGIGNEIAFYVFDYPPEEELGVRAYIQTLGDRLRIERRDLQFASINLFAFVIKYIEELGLLDKCFELQRKEGNDALLVALKGALNSDKVARRFAEVVRPSTLNLVLVHGLGAAFPLLRTHSLLSNLQPHMDQTPLVLFFPGAYSEGRLQLFCGTEPAAVEHNYYRALRLIDETEQAC